MKSDTLFFIGLAVVAMYAIYQGQTIEGWNYVTSCSLCMEKTGGVDCTKNGAVQAFMDHCEGTSTNPSFLKYDCRMEDLHTEVVYVTKYTGSNLPCIDEFGTSTTIPPYGVTTTTQPGPGGLVFSSSDWTGLGLLTAALIGFMWIKKKQ
jgi:hypothetical protein